MDRKTLLLLLISILLVITIFSVLSMFSLKKKSHRIPVSIQESMTITEAPAAKPASVTIIAPAVEVVAKKETAKDAAATKSRPIDKVPFWGNRGYIFRNGKSTYVTDKILMELKVAYETAPIAERED